jgi:hypothetical protein
MITNDILSLSSTKSIPKVTCNRYAIFETYLSMRNGSGRPGRCGYIPPRAAKTPPTLQQAAGPYAALAVVSADVSGGMGGVVGGF